MKIKVTHETCYAYDSPTKRSIQLLRVTPLSLGRQKVLSWSLALPRCGSELFDGFGNCCTLLSLPEPHECLRIKAQGEVELEEDLDWLEDDRLPPGLFLRETPLTRCTGPIREMAARRLGRGVSRRALQALSADILAHMPYAKGRTGVSTSADEAFALGVGVCQDHTHVFLAGARAMGVPARYVSGYLYTESEQHLASHAWAEAWLDGRWYVFDVSNQLFAPARHVQIALGLDYNDAAPVRGIRVGGGHEHMDYRVQVAAQQ
jgi:transglutaminase-like putative cysteine protease